MSSQQAQHEPGPIAYAGILLILLALLALTVAIAFVDLDAILPGHFWSRTVALSIAAAKALLIMLYFMHIRFGGRTTVVFSFAGFAWLGIMLVLTMSDYLTRNHPADLNPKGEPRYLSVVDSEQQLRH